MTQEEWNNAAQNSLAARLRNNGYSTAPPRYNPYAVNYNRQVPITQAFTREVPQYIQSTDYNGQPVRVPANASSQLADYATNAARWAGAQAVQNLAIKGLTGNSLGGWAGIGANKYVPIAANALIGWHIPQVTNAVNAGRNLISTPAVQTLGNGIKKAIDWIF